MGPQPSCPRSPKNPAIVKKIRGDESGLETDRNVEGEEMTYKRLPCSAGRKNTADLL